jgi:hypothetical protein
MLRAQAADEEEYGFLRASSLLMLVIVSDEADCSYNNEWQSIFLPASMGGNQVFWSDPNASAPTSAVCWNAGVACTGVGPFDECHAEGKNVEGVSTTSPDEMVLQPMSRYLDFLRQVELDKQGTDPGTRVLVAVIGGVPLGYQDGEAIPYAPASDPAIQLGYGIGPACMQPDGVGFAVPAVRERGVAEAFADNGRNLWSVCDASYDMAMDGIAQMIAKRVGGG